MKQHYNPNTDPKRPTRAWEVVLCLGALLASVVILYLGA